jgi:hypothetical protein
MLNLGEDDVASWLGCLLSPIYHLLFLSLFLPEDSRKARSACLSARFRLLVRHPPSFVLQSCTIFLPRSSTSPLIATTTTTNNHSSANFFPSHIIALKWTTRTLSFSLIQVVLFCCKEEKKNHFYYRIDCFYFLYVTTNSNFSYSTPT